MDTPKIIQFPDRWQKPKPRFRIDWANVRRETRINGKMVVVEYAKVDADDTQRDAPEKCQESP